MEELQGRQRQEQKDLQSRITQKKKSATKKTRKGVNDECTELERRLRERHAAEIAALHSNDTPEVADCEPISDQDDEISNIDKSKDISESMNGVSISPNPTTNGHPKKPNRQKARLARRAAEQEAANEEAEKEAANLPNLRERERNAMREAYTFRGLKEHEIRSDGHCLYAAVADQLEQIGVGLQPNITLDVTRNGDVQLEPSSNGYKMTRQVAAAYISQNPDDFVPFLEEPLDQYVMTIRDTGEWGGHLEILALAKAYGVDISILQADGRVEQIECGINGESKTLWLAYYHHSYGLGEHYNSLRKAA